MTGAERGFLLLCCHLGDPQRRPLTVAQFRKLARLVRSGEKHMEDREMELSDLMQLGCGKEEAQRILSLLGEEERLDRYLMKGAKFGCVPLTPLSPGYPRRLLTSLGDDAPACLWARGDLSLLERPGVALVGFKKAGTTPKRKMAEFKDMPEVNLGDTLTVDMFSEEDWVDVTGISKGKGFQGVVKRHGFGGVGGQTHGQHNRQRKPGSLGASSYPSRVFKGKRLAGRMGGDQVKCRTPCKTLFLSFLVRSIFQGVKDSGSINSQS